MLADYHTPLPKMNSKITSLKAGNSRFCYYYHEQDDRPIKGFGFVEMSNDDEAQKANRSMFNGRNLFSEQARPGSSSSGGFRGGEDKSRLKAPHYAGHGFLLLQSIKQISGIFKRLL